MKNKMKNPDYILKMGFVILGVFVVLAAIIGSWIWNLLFDPSHFDLNKWANRAIFCTAISLAMMVLGFIAINEGQKSREEGKYMNRIEAFNDLVTKFFDTNIIVYFDQFIIWYCAKQLRDKKIKYLTRHGISVMDAQILIDNATLDDIPVLTGLHSHKEIKKVLWWKKEIVVVDKPTGHKGQDIVRKDKDGNDVLIPAINDTLAAYLEEVLNGTIYVDVEDSSFYTTIDKNKDSNLSSLERAQHTEQDRVRSLRISFITKGITGVFFATLVALLAVDLNQGVGSAEALWSLMSRLISAILGFGTGGFAGLTNVNYLYKYIGDKMKVDMEYEKYLTTGEFVPKTYSEIMKQKIAELQVKKEEQKPLEQPKDVEETVKKEVEETTTIFATDNK